MKLAISSISCTLLLSVGCSASDPGTGAQEPAQGGTGATPTGGAAGSGTSSGTSGSQVGTTAGSGGSGAPPGTGVAGSVGTAGTMTSGNPPGSGGSGSVGMPPGMPTGTLASSWLGFQAPDVVTGTNLVPVVSSDCPVDPDMANGIALFQDSGASPDALLFDWEHQYGGWHSAAIGPTGWAVLSVAATAKLVFWIKGDKGGEEAAFTLRINFHDNTNSDTLYAPAIPAVTTSWKKITMPLSQFGNGNYASGVASVGTGNSHAAMHAKYYIDNIYFATQ
jgi:Carbohydrate binding domain (family 11)